MAHVKRRVRHNMHDQQGPIRVRDWDRSTIRRDLSNAFHMECAYPLKALWSCHEDLAQFLDVRFELACRASDPESVAVLEDNPMWRQRTLRNPDHDRRTAVSKRDRLGRKTCNTRLKSIAGHVLQTQALGIGVAREGLKSRRDPPACGHSDDQVPS